MKAIKIGTLELEITPERKRRIISTMVETQGQLDKELSYRKDLQFSETIEFYQNHLVKLAEMLNE